MDLHIDNAFIDKMVSEFAKLEGDAEVEELIGQVQIEAMEFALEQCGMTMSEFGEDGEKAMHAGVIMSRWMCVQIVALREILQSRSEGDGPTV